MRVKTFPRVLRIISCFVLFFFVWTYGPIYAAVAYAATDQKTEDRSQRSVQTTEKSNAERFEKALEDIRKNIGDAEVKAGKGQDASTELEAIKAKKAEIESLDGEFKKGFSATEKKLFKDANLPQEIRDRHDGFVKHYEENLEELRTNLDSIEQSAKAKSHELGAALQEARLYLDKTGSMTKHVPLDPNNLPFQNRKAKAAKAPRLKKEDFEKDFGTPKKRTDLAADERTLHSRLVHSYASGTSRWTQINFKPAEILRAMSYELLHRSQELLYLHTTTTTLPAMFRCHWVMN